MIDIKTDSRKVQKGDTFIAIRNINHDGHDYIEDAIKNGAEKIICEEGKYSVKTVIVPNTREYLQNYLKKEYYPKFSDLKLIGITGTNGKTTTANLIYQLLNKQNRKCAMIGTLGFFCGDIHRELDNTTPDIDLLYDMLLEAKENECEFVVMEVSSHALAQNRVYGLEYDAVGFTNLTQDHLDFHKTMDEYQACKEKLFTMTRDKKLAVINGDDERFRAFIKDGNESIIISEKHGDAIITDVELSNQGLSFCFKYNNRLCRTHLNMVGKYNIYNFITAVLILDGLGVNIEDTLKYHDEVTPPCGRMEMIKFKTNCIFVDYAHTPDAVFNVLKAVNECKKGKIITIIGCGGDRDRTKRSVMGYIAETYSDYVIFTNDNPRTEPQEQIMNDILSGVKKDNHEVLFNRRLAIEKGINMLNDKDTLLVLGKGHEDYQIIGTTKFHFSDQEIVLKRVKERNEENFYERNE